MIDYKKLWEELLDRLSYFNTQGVNEIHPQLIKEYMRLMVDTENAENVEKPGH